MKRFVLFCLFSFAIFALLLFSWDRSFLIKEGLIHYEPKKAEVAAVKETLNLYYKTMEDFFASGGDPAMIDTSPASKILKHEIFKEIGMMRDNDRIAVYDLTSSKVERLRFTAPDQADVTTHEVWVLQYQTGKREPAGPIRSLQRVVTYTLRRGGEGWRVMTWDPV